MNTAATRADARSAARRAPHAPGGGAGPVHGMPAGRRAQDGPAGRRALDGGETESAVPRPPRAADVASLRRLRVAKDLMDRDWARPLDLDTVAAHAGYSRYHFIRRFRDAYGETPGQYLTRRRIERAQDLLRSADLTVTEVCMVVGFTSLGTFCTRFKKQVGATPTEFRARAHRSGPTPIPGCFLLYWAGGFRPE